MKYNRKLLGKARAELASIHQKNIDEHEKRVRIVYKKVPEIERIDTHLRLSMIELARTVFSGGNADIEKIKEDNLTLQMKRLEALVEAGFPQNYLDDIYTCPICKDTGYDEKRRNCKCLDSLYKKALSQELSSLMLCGDESFDKFNLSLYPANARSHMEQVLNLCRDYAEEFTPDTDNLLLYGPPGLGKTFISACIAREVISLGYSVVYDTCSNVVNAFELKQYFNPDQEESRAKVDSVLNCDLMILDDLGTESTNSAAMSAIYNIINTRIISGKATIINTNFIPEELHRRYSPAICSRITGCYTPVDFVGSDIRIILKER